MTYSTTIAIAMMSLSLLACVDDTSGGGSGVVDCAPSLALYDREPWSEPDRPQPTAAPLSPPKQGWLLRRILPPDANSSDLPTAWLTGDEDLSAELEVAYGREETTPRTLSVSLFLDGLQVLVPDPDEQLVPALKQPIAPGEVKSLALRVPGSEIGSGAHSGNILVKRDPAVDVFGLDLTVLKESTTFSNRTPPSDVTPEPAENSGSRVYLTDRPLSLLRGDLNLAELGGELPLTFVVKTARDTCADHSYRFVVVALLDGVQIEIPGQGMAPAFEMRGDEQARFSATFSELPMDGEPHTLEFWVLADGNYSEAPEGELAPWSEWPRELGWTRWQ